MYGEIFLVGLVTICAYQKGFSNRLATGNRIICRLTAASSASGVNYRRQTRSMNV